MKCKSVFFSAVFRDCRSAVFFMSIITYLSVYFGCPLNQTVLNVRLPNRVTVPGLSCHHDVNKQDAYDNMVTIKAI